MPQTSSDPSNAESPRVAKLDSLRGLAAIQVIITHIGYLIAVPSGYIKLTDSLLRYEVPLFLILSGALVSTKPKFGAKEFWIPKIKRLLIPYTICTAILTILAGKSFYDFLIWFITADAAVPYYFFIVIFQCYLLFYLKPKFFWSKYCLPLAFAVSMLCLVLAPKTPLVMSPFFGPFFAYFCYGCCHRVRISKGQSLQGAQFQLLLVILIIVMLNFTFIPNAFVNYGYLYPIAIFELLLFLSGLQSLKTFVRILNFLGSYSLWIFLVHYPIVKLVIEQFGFQNTPYLQGLLVLSVPLIVVSVLVAVICQKLYQFVLSPHIVTKV